MLRVSPKVSMFDSTVRIWVEGLQASEKITLFCSMKHEIGNFESCARFVADPRGKLYLKYANSVGGSFQGVHPMGLLWSLKPCAGQKRGTMFAIRDVTRPINVQLDVVRGHVTDVSPAYPPLNSVTFERHFVHSAVKRLPVRHGRIRGTLFYPKNFTKPLPVIMDLQGTAGGLNETRAAYFSSKGFAALSLAFFRFDDLPKGLKPGQLSVEYFEEAIDWLLMQHYLDRSAIGIFGSSFGAELACILASVSPKVRAVVACNGFHMLDSFNQISIRGKQWPTAELKSLATLSEKDLINGTDLLYAGFRDQAETSDDKVFPIEKSGGLCKFIFVAGKNDGMTPSVKSFEFLTDRLVRAGLGHLCQTLIYEDLGHPVEPPYFPHSDVVFHKYAGVNVLLGGTPVGNMKMQQDLWPKVLKFFEDNLGKPEVMPNFDAENFAQAKL